MKKILFLTLISLLSYSCSKTKTEFKYRIETTADCMVNYYNHHGEHVDTTIKQNIFEYKWSEEYKGRPLYITAYTITTGGAMAFLYMDDKLIASDTCNGRFSIAEVRYNY